MRYECYYLIRDLTITSRPGRLQPVTGNNHLADTSYTTIILRIVLNKQGHIVYGELVDVVSSQTKRFKTWNELIRALSKRLKVASTHHRTDRISSKSNQP